MLSLEIGDKMPYASDRTKEQILEYATKEFLEKGFSGANIRDIAKYAGVTTGAIYNHYNGKEGLFHELVGETADTVIQMTIDAHKENDYEVILRTMNSEERYNATTSKFIDYMYDNWTSIKLLFDCAIGSEYENFIDEIIKIDEIATVNMYKKLYAEIDESTEFFLHVIASASIEQMVEIVKHNLKKDVAINYMKKIYQFYSVGFKDMLQDN